ncbi:MAG: carbohydrate binding domain-containing protein [Ignavibacteria bacterium]|nr:carbohydrate binding domain-containing protein [Ignavibacteria bacterium]
MVQLFFTVLHSESFKLKVGISILLFFFLSGNLSSQVISQNFDGIAAGSLPSGWTIIPYSTNPNQTDNNNAPATGNSWKVINPASASLSALSAPNAIVCGASVNEKSSDWFFTKSVALESGTFYNLRVAASWTNPYNLPGAPAVSFGYCRDVNGNGIPEPLGADASGYTDWSGLGSGPNSWSNYNVAFTVPSSGNYFIFMLSLVVGPIITDTGPNYLALDNFSVEKGSGLKLTSPVGGEVWNSGSTHPITWTSTGVTTVKIEYSLDWGTTWTTLTSSASASAGTYTWNLPIVDETKNTCLVKITDVSNAAVTSSSSMFTIQLKVAGTVSLYSPNGGETWNAGAQQWIGFTSTDIPYVKIEYSTNGGTTWITLSARETTANGGYAWTIPNTPSTQCKVRVSDADDPTVYDISDANFTIAGSGTKYVTLSSPNGGEIWAPNTSHDIKWSSYGVINVTLEFSSNNGTSWSTIISSVAANLASYSWTTPNITSTNCLVRISDYSNKALYDVSNAVFSIKLVKTIQLTSPNGGESWNVGSTQPITWSAQGITSVKIEYSINNGTSWNTVATSSGTSYSWSIPDAVSAQCLVRVSDASDATLKDISDGVFSIVKIASVTVLSPNGGEKLVVGTTAKILWNSTNISNVKIEVKLDLDYYYIPIATVSASTGSYDWLISTEYFSMLHGNCLIRISDATNADINDVSDGYFSLVPILKLITPNGGESWMGGTIQQIKWDALPNFYVSLDYSTNNGSVWTRIKRDILASDKLYNWAVPNTPSTQCLVRIKSTYDSLNVFDIGDAVFTITPAPVPVLKILTPNGGEKIAPGEKYLITWQSANVDSIMIQYSLSNGQFWFTEKLSYPAAGGSFLWSIPVGYTSIYNECLIKISDVKNSTVRDFSDNVFSIGPYVSVISPNGGESWMANTIDTIKWKSGGLNRVDIDLSTDNGTTWTNITMSQTASTGSYAWGVTNTVSSKCLFKVFGSSDKGISDVSDAVFSIIPLAKKITVVSPNGGEKLIHGNEYYFRWTSSNVKYVRIEYSTNAGASWLMHKSNWWADSTRYLWVPNALFNSTSCLARISDANDSTTYDISDALFSILPAPPKTLALLTPKGGEVCVKGSNQLVTWKAEIVKTVKIEYSLNGGTSWVVAADSIPAVAESYLLKLPETASAQCFVRISDKSDAAVKATNALPFTIFGLALTFPNGGEKLYGKDVLQVKWTSDYVSKIRLEYTFDEGITWRLMKDSVDASLKLFNWTIPNLAVASGRVRITNLDVPSFVDQSDNSFSITKTYAPNLIINGDFTNGAANWGSYIDANATAAFTFTGGVANLTVSKAGTQTWHIQLLQTNLKIEQGKTYDLIFLASATGARTVDVGISQSSGTYTSYGSQVFSLTTTPQTYSLSFKMNSVTDMQARFYANLGNSLFGVKFDDIILREHDFEKDLKLIAPAKAVVYKTGDKPVINWLAQNIATVNIFYKLWNSSSWVSIAQKAAAAQGSYSWTIPSMVNDSCQIRIEDSTDPQLFVLSEKFYLQTVTGLSEEPNTTPRKYSISQNYPNPFNPSTTIEYQLLATSDVNIEIFNVMGEKKEIIFDGIQNAGIHSVVWTANVPSGIYFYRIKIVPVNGTAKPIVEVKKMILTK